MLPDHNHQPSVAHEVFNCLRVTSSVRLLLQPPPIAVGRGKPPVLGTAVPPAPSHVDGNSRTPEDDISFTAETRDQALVDLVPESSLVQRAAQQHLGPCVALTLGCETSTVNRTRWGWGSWHRSPILRNVRNDGLVCRTEFPHLRVV